MFVGWNGSGPLAVIVPAVLVFGYLLAINCLGVNLGPLHLWVLGGLFALSGTIVFSLGRKLNTPLDLMSQRLQKETGNIPYDLRQRHGIYGVRMELWGLGEFLIGAFFIGERILNLM